MEAVILRVLESNTLRLVLKIISAAAVLSAVISFPLTLVFIFKDSYTDALLTVSAALLSFLLLTLSRLLINARRPYEVYKSLKAPDGAHKGLSFPSRHLFSIFYIATLSSYASPYLALILLILGAMLGVCRVLLGIHFIRDTVFGAIIGVILSLLTLSLIHGV